MYFSKQHLFLNTSPKKHVDVTWASTALSLPSTSPASNTHRRPFSDLLCFHTPYTYTTVRCCINCRMTYQSYWSPESVLFICLSKDSIGNRCTVSFVLFSDCSTCACVCVFIIACVGVSWWHAPRLCASGGGAWGVICTPWRSPICLICKALTSIVELHLPCRNVTSSLMDQAVWVCVRMWSVSLHVCVLIQCVGCVWVNHRGDDLEIHFTRV